MVKKFFCVALAGIFFSCTIFEKKSDENAVARVGENYLYEDEINTLLGERLNKDDSAMVVQNYINGWAKKQLLVERAKINLDKDKMAEFERLIEEYRIDLLTAAYKEALVNQGMDTIISEDELTRYYEDHKENFKLNEELLKLRYVQIDQSFSDVESVKERLTRFNEEDKLELEAIALQFKSFSLNDSIWIKAVQFIQKVPLINANNRSRYLKKSQFFELTDSLEVYLVHVNDILKRNETAPLEYVKPTIQQIILNKRKLEFIRNLEKDLIDDAIQKKQFEVYEKN
ncbi:peptidyl-prolyl cis-trans isomerase [Leptobacterium flavescens]|uniref:Peptidyl-prolyl cis-trans isomerase n=1 Tax=Leptobacterium flavescens TaxID=472055 RepID=A0A6P0UYK8_9FLAO|nr:peptidyl-prolyl cis-trans isomerase [Leptobacterium flavescens]NER15536.1 peptidyl-prolyl cis-trans isomerase [Leptobacterium flavescens]